MEVPLQKISYLSEQDRHAITWLKRPPLPPGEVPLFDLKSRIEWAESIYKAGHTKGSDLRSLFWISHKEAWFWLVFFEFFQKNKSASDKKLADLHDLLDGIGEPPSTEAVLVQLKKKQIERLSLVAVARPFCTPTELMKVILELMEGTKLVHEPAEVLRDYSRHLLPTLSLEERAEVRNFLEQIFRSLDPTSRQAQLCMLALSRFGGEAFVRYLGSPEGKVWAYFDLQSLAGLPDEEAFIREANLRVSGLRGEAEIRLWLAATEWRELHMVEKAFVNSRKSKTFVSSEELKKAVRVLGLIKSTHTAETMLRIETSVKQFGLSRSWLLSNPLFSIIALTPIANQAKQTNYVTVAFNILHELIHAGHRQFFIEARPHLLAEQWDWLNEQVIPNPETPLSDLDPNLAAELMKVEPLERPKWMRQVRLPTLKVGTKRLSDRSLLTIFTAIKSTRLGGAHPIFDLLKQQADPLDLDECIAELLNKSCVHKSPAEENWIIKGVAFLGGKLSVVALARSLEYGHLGSSKDGFNLGLDALLAEGSDQAFLALCCCSKDSSRFDLQRLLLDRIGKPEHVPETFNSGGEKFHLSILNSQDGPKAILRDSSGQRFDQLPLTATFLGREEETEQQQWRLAGDRLALALEHSANQMEHHMVVHHRWTFEEFGELRKNIIDCHLATRLIWGVYRDGLAETFCVLEDGTFLDHEHNTIAHTLLKGSVIGIVHPFDLTGAERSNWGEYLSDNQFYPPFPQINRRLVEPFDLDDTAVSIRARQHSRLPWILSKHHWELAEIRGRIVIYFKYFKDHDTRAEVLFNISVGKRHVSSIIQEVRFLKGDSNQTSESAPSYLQIRDVPRYVFSEVLGFLETLFVDELD